MFINKCHSRLMRKQFPLSFSTVSVAKKEKVAAQDSDQSIRRAASKLAHFNFSRRHFH